MRKNFIKLLVLFLLVFISTEIVFAVSFSYGKYFGGKITNTKATEIQKKEDSGYTCELNGGKSITIKPVKGESTYMIPSSKNTRMISSGKWILGKYNGKTVVTCKKQCGETECKETVSLNTITLFNISN